MDIPAIIPLTSAATTAPPPAPPPPPPAPPLPSVLPSVSDDSQASANNPPPPPPPVRSGDDDDDDGGNPLLAEIRNFGKKKTLKSAAERTTDRLNAAPSPAPKGEESHMDILKARLQQRRRFINGESGPSGAEKSAAAPTPPPAISTGGAMTDLIAAKAKEVADIKQRQKSDSDKDTDDSDEDWE